MMPHPSQCIALTIAGSDSSGGAGLQADLKAFYALGVHGATAITWVTAQNEKSIDAVQSLPPDFVSQQIKTVAADLNIGAAKTGMLGDAATIEAVANAVDAHLKSTPLIVDPVMVATSGARLLDEAAVTVLRDVLIPKAELITPNLLEAAILSNRDTATTAEEMQSQAETLLGLGVGAALVKGGHLARNSKDSSAAARDVLATREGVRWFEAPLIATTNTHGTGCTLSAAITAERAKGTPLQLAIARAKEYLTEALRAAAGGTP